MDKWAAVCLAAPACVLAVGLALTLLLGAAGRHPMWRHQELNLSEAAAARDEGNEVPVALERHRPSGAVMRCEGVSPW